MQDLVRKLGEYITAMRIELERKKIVGSVRLNLFKGFFRETKAMKPKLELQSSAAI